MPGVASSGLPGAAAGPSSGLLPGSSLTPRPSCIVAIAIASRPISLKLLTELFADVTSLGCTGPEMSYLVETAVAPAIKTLGLTFSISTPSSQYARYIVIETGGYTGASGFVTRQGRSTCDADAVISKLRSLHDQGGGTFGMALADGMAAAGECLFVASPEVERHCVVVAGSPPLDKLQTASPHFEAGMGVADVTTRLAQKGVFLSVFATHQSPILKDVFSAHSRLMHAQLNSQQLSEQNFRGCLMLSQIPKRPDPQLLRRQRHMKQQESQSMSKRARIGDTSATSLQSASSSTAFITNHRFSNVAPWGGTLTWDIHKISRINGAAKPQRKAKVLVSAFLNTAAAQFTPKFRWKAELEIANYFPLGKVLQLLHQGKDVTSMHAQCFLQFRPASQQEDNLKLYAWLVQFHIRQQVAGVMYDHGKGAKETIITFAEGSVLYGYYVGSSSGAKTQQESRQPPRTPATAAPGTAANGVVGLAAGKTQSRQDARPTVTPQFHVPSEALQSLQRSTLHAAGKANVPRPAGTVALAMTGDGLSARRASGGSLPTAAPPTHDLGAQAGASAAGVGGSKAKDLDEWMLGVSGLLENVEGDTGISFNDAASILFQK